MRFKATIRDARTFAAVCRSAQGFQRKCTLKLAPERVRFITTTGASDGTQIWSSSRVDTLFSDFRIESSRQNTIFLEIADISILGYALRNCEKGAAVNPTIKLAKVGENGSCLRLSFQSSLNQHDVSYDILVRVLSDQEINGIVAPPLERDVLQAVFPNLSEIALFLDRARAAAQGTVVTFHLKQGVQGQALPDSTGTSMGNTLTITSHTIISTFSLQYQNIEIPPILHRKRPRDDGEEGEDDGQEEEDEGELRLPEASVSIDAKRFARFMSVREVNPVKVVGHVVDGRALVLSAYAAGETNLVYYIPATAGHGATMNY